MAQSTHGEALPQVQRIVIFRDGWLGKKCKLARALAGILLKKGGGEKV